MVMGEGVVEWGSGRGLLCDSWPWGRAGGGGLGRERDVVIFVILFHLTRVFLYNLEGTTSIKKSGGLNLPPFVLHLPGNAVCSSILAVVKQTIDQTGAVQAGENWLQRILAFWVDNYPFLFELPHCDRDRNVIRLGPRVGQTFLARGVLVLVNGHKN